MMDWESLLGLAGVYIMLVANMAYQWMTTKRMIELESSNNDLLKSNDRILELIGDIIVVTAEKNRSYGIPTDDYETKPAMMGKTKPIVVEPSFWYRVDKNYC